MTIIEAINRIDALKPNSYSQTEKIGWLSELEGMIKNNVINTHEGGDGIDFGGYDPEACTSDTLLVGNPYEEIYITWMESKIDYYNGEFTRYNNSSTRFNDLYTEFQNAYNRKHMPIQTAMRYF